MGLPRGMTQDRLLYPSPARADSSAGSFFFIRISPIPEGMQRTFRLLTGVHTVRLAQTTFRQTVGGDRPQGRFEPPHYCTPQRSSCFSNSLRWFWREQYRVVRCESLSALTATPCRLRRAASSSASAFARQNSDSLGQSTLIHILVPYPGISSTRKAGLPEKEYPTPPKKASPP